MENWRGYLKESVGTKDLYDLGDRYPQISDERLRDIANAVEAYMLDGSPEAYESLGGDEKAYADELITLNQQLRANKSSARSHEVEVEI